MPLQSELDVQGALIYFHAYMYGPYQGRARLFRKSIAARWIKENANPLLCIVNGEAVDGWPSEICKPGCRGP